MLLPSTILTCFCSLPSYLYPDGKNHNPDLTELCHMEPHQLIHVSEVKLRPAPPCPPAFSPLPPPPPNTHTDTRGSGIPSRRVRPGVPGLGGSCCVKATGPDVNHLASLRLCSFSGKCSSSCRCSGLFWGLDPGTGLVRSSARLTHLSIHGPGPGSAPPPRVPQRNNKYIGGFFLSVSISHTMVGTYLYLKYQTFPFILCVSENQMSQSILYSFVNIFY